MCAPNAFVIQILWYNDKWDIIPVLQRTELWEEPSRPTCDERKALQTLNDVKRMRKFGIIQWHPHVSPLCVSNKVKVKKWKITANQLKKKKIIQASSLPRIYTYCMWVHLCTKITFASHILGVTANVRMRTIILGYHSWLSLNWVMVF